MHFSCADGDADMAQTDFRPADAAAPDMTQQLKTKAEEAVGALAGEAAKALEDPDRYLKDIQASAVRYIRVNPMQSLAVAAAAAFAVGALWNSGPKR
jgi:ElaB/YqjD/DUF883 family membrane-anchored ribosome-binding protein